MTTARDLCQGAAEALQIYAPGEQLLDADASRLFLLLNQMIDSWSNESLTCYAILEQSVALQVGQLSYTIGPGGQINATRPIRIIDGPGAAYLLDVNGNRYPIDVVPRDQWNQIWNISSTVTSTLPDTLFYDPQFPLGIINIYPQYAGGLGVTAFWDSYLQLSDFASLTGAVSLPPGYERMIQTNLAIEAAPYFPTAVVSPALAKAASESKANVKRSNIRENVAQFEKVLTSRAGAVYNPYSDGYR
jgi:hypothetical protein